MRTSLTLKNVESCPSKYFKNTANCYSKTTALLRQKGCTLDFAMAIGGILEFAVPLPLKSHIFYC